MLNASDLIWFDFEVASLLNLKAVGAFRYATDASTRAIILAYAIGSGTPAVCCARINPEKGDENVI